MTDNSREGWMACAVVSALALSACQPKSPEPGALKNPALEPEQYEVVRSCASRTQVIRLPDGRVGTERYSYDAGYWFDPLPAGMTPAEFCS